MSGLHYVSHDVVLEAVEWRVRVGMAVVTPEPQVFELLSYMMRNPGRTVSKGELLDALWSGDVVGESVLTRCVSCARKLLGDDSKTPRFIRTLHGRGYQFIAPVSEVAAPTVAPDLGAEPAAQIREGSLPPAAQGEFVGRVAELALLREAVRKLGNRSCELIMVSGEAGIGKTYLLDEAIRLTPPTTEVHKGHCSPVEGSPPFLAWQQCFRSIVRARTLRAVLRTLSDTEGDTRRLLLGERGQLVDGPAVDSPSKRFRTFDAIASSLETLAQQRPIVLVLDDLQFADLGSLLLLEFLIQRRPQRLLILGGVREGEHIAEEARAATLANIRSTCGRDLALSGFSPAEVKQFVEQRLQCEGDALAGSLYSRTGGNPFFLSVLTMAHDPARSHKALPTAIRQAVSNRLSRLDSQCLKLLRLASVWDREFEAATLARMGELTTERTLAALQLGCVAGVITRTKANAYRFVHDLVREVMYAEMGAEERARAHLSVGRALETHPSYQHAQQAAMLAHHFMQGAHFGGAARALDLSIRAGAYALRNFAYEEAIEHFTRASTMLASDGEGDHASQCAVLLDLGLAQVSAGLREAGQKTLTLAAAKARELGATAELASVALSLSPGLFAIEVGGYDPTLVALLREALAQVGQDNDRLRALLLARLALAMYWSDTFDERAAICEEASMLAERVGAEDVKAAVTTAHSLALLRSGNLKERRALSQQALDLCGRVSDHHGLLLNHVHRATLLLEDGDEAGARLEVEAIQKLARDVNQPQAIWVGSALTVARLFMDGRLSEVEAIAGDYLQTGQRVRDHNALQSFGVQLTLVRIEQGRGAEMLDALRHYTASYPRVAAWRAVLAHALSRSGRLDEAAAIYQSAKSTGFALPDDLLWLYALSLFSEICHEVGDAQGAKTLYERLAPFASRVVVVGYSIACTGALAQYLAMLGVTAGDDEAAHMHFEQAIITNRRLRAMLPLAYTLYRYAAFLSRRAGEQARALDCLREAKHIALERGLLALMERIAQFNGVPQFPQQSTH
jgi:DNA-binding winged helix-turn-helix (wHTH) protein/tetratricopeptide (TPR) repeat protein